MGLVSLVALIAASPVPLPFGMGLGQADAKTTGMATGMPGDSAGVRPVEGASAALEMIRSGVGDVGVSGWGERALGSGSDSGHGGVVRVQSGGLRRHLMERSCGDEGDDGDGDDGGEDGNDGDDGDGDGDADDHEEANEDEEDNVEERACE